MDVAMELTGLFRSHCIAYAVIPLVIALWCHYKWNRRDIDRLAAKLTGPPSYPIVGSGLEFLGSPQQVMENIIKLCNDYGPEPFKFWMGTSLGVYIIKPEDLQIVLNSSKALEKGSFYKFLKSVLGEGLGTAPVDKWKVNRRIIAPVFNSNFVNQFLTIFNQKTGILINNLNKEVDKSRPFDLWDYVAPASLDLICQTTMGYNLNSQSNKVCKFTNALRKASELYAMRIYKPWLYPDMIFSIYGKLTGGHKVYKNVLDLPNRVIKEAKGIYAQKKIINNKSNTSDDSSNEGKKKSMKVFLDILFELKETGANFTDENIRDEVVTMLIAGSETNAVTTCFFLLLVAIHPNIQDKMYDEIYEIMGDGTEEMTVEDLNKLVYLEQGIKETLRLFPTVPIFLRNLQDDVKIYSGNHVLPKGTTCIISALATHHLPEIYPNPWSFNPDNFNPENVVKRHKYSFLPFSGGPRGCIGSKYAMMAMKIILSTILRNFSVHTDTKLSDIKLKLDILMKSVHGYPVTIKPRDRRPSNIRNQKV